MTDTRTVLACLGKELETLRKARRWTRPHAVAQLRRRLGVELSVRSLVSYERGDRPVPFERLLELCALYEVPVPAVVSLAIRRADWRPNSRRERRTEDDGLSVDSQLSLRSAPQVTRRSTP